ncbi:hypothetical protein Cantr_01055 [Candida viswanathii]|uniref:Uncharacterized protein n=1 Tax=Candida viswanathii TaxID=5486 RepID=A0A367YHI4_9ASCO|nr:hypothetical protein Cantr_01055 [Candida viswanathii]
MVNCYTNGEIVSLVDYENGVCEFIIPDSCPTVFPYASSSNYEIRYYYAQVNGVKYTTDIQRAGRVISVPARLLVSQGIALFQVHLQKSPTRRLVRKSDIEEEYVDVNEFVASIADTEGSPLDVTISDGVVSAGFVTASSVAGEGTIVCEIAVTETETFLWDACPTPEQIVSGPYEAGLTATHADSSGEASATLSELRDLAVSTGVLGAVSEVDVIVETSVVLVVTSVVTQCRNNVCSESTATLVDTLPVTTSGVPTALLIDTGVAGSSLASNISMHASPYPSQSPAIVTPIENSASKSSTRVSWVCGLILSILVIFP